MVTVQCGAKNSRSAQGNIETYLAEIRGSADCIYLIDTIFKALGISLYLSPQAQPGAIFSRGGAQVSTTTEDFSRNKRTDI